jgi:hypothetical protein
MRSRFRNEIFELYSLGNENSGRIIIFIGYDTFVSVLRDNFRMILECFFDIFHAIRIVLTFEWSCYRLDASYEKGFYFISSCVLCVDRGAYCNNGN